MFLFALPHRVSQRAYSYTHQFDNAPDGGMNYIRRSEEGFFFFWYTAIHPPDDH
jgi:hypothetical protein